MLRLKMCIQSSNYSAGTAGWKIDKTGTDRGQMMLRFVEH